MHMYTQVCIDGHMILWKVCGPVLEDTQWGEMNDI